MRGDATGRNTTLATFIERGYLPDQKLRRRASTYAEYEGMFTRHIKLLPESQLPLWQYRKAHVQRLLDAIAAKKLMSRMTHKHLKAFLANPPKGPDGARWVEHAESALNNLEALPPPAAAGMEGA